MLGRRSLTGAWIETIAFLWLNPKSCRSLTGAWIETATGIHRAVAHWGRSLTGAWIETFRPTKERDSAESLPYGGVD